MSLAAQATPDTLRKWVAAGLNGRVRGVVGARQGLASLGHRPRRQVMRIRRLGLRGRSARQRQIDPLARI